MKLRNAASKKMRRFGACAANLDDEVSLRTLQSGVWLVAVIAMATSLLAQTNGTLISNPVFEKNCAKCHGKTAEGSHFGGPSLVSEEVRQTSADDLRNIIMNGKHRMPKYAGKLTSEQIDTLVSQIKAADKK
jgi:cytochrome c5